jgi:transcriptional regulator with AAA-type ATPase domain
VKGPKGVLLLSTARQIAPRLILTYDAAEPLKQYDRPGNVWELQQLIERADDPGQERPADYSVEPWRIPERSLLVNVQAARPNDRANVISHIPGCVHNQPLKGWFCAFRSGRDPG